MTTELVMSNWRARSGDAGAIMAEETGEMKVKAETIAVAAHLRLKLQLDRRRRRQCQCIECEWQ